MFSFCMLANTMLPGFVLLQNYFVPYCHKGRVWLRVKMVQREYFNPYPANMENMVSS
jgi:hypothetical protein